MEHNEEIRIRTGAQPPEAMEQTVVESVGTERIRKFVQVLTRYRSGRLPTELRIRASENWWQLRNAAEEQKRTEIGKDGGFKSKSGWLHNVITSKHADAMEAYPEPNILPRESGDKGEALKLSAIVPCVLEQNKFEKTYSDVMWQKMKTGTGLYKVTWDQGKLNGLGDIHVAKANLLNVYWEPGVTNIQDSRYVFHTEMVDRDVLEERYPELKDQHLGNAILSSEFESGENKSNENKVTVVEVYYHKFVKGKKTLQYCKFVGEHVIYATENMTEPEMNQFGEKIGEPKALTGLYNHGKFPYVFDPLFPIEGSPCGYGFVDVCQNPQTEIDLMKTGFLKNVQVNAIPRYWSRTDGNVNEEEFLDLSKAIVHAANISEDTLRPIETKPLDGSCITMLDSTIQELRETSGNTETSTGNVSSGVTAASAIAALQEASGKGSRDSTQGSYRAYEEVVEMVIELIRQFYELPRQFRILGEYGAHQYISYSNAGIKPQHQGNDFGQDMGFRTPVFDIKVSAQKQNVYTKVTQNELAIQFFNLGFFNPQMTDQALLCLEMMDFEGKDEIMQKVANLGTMQQKLMQYMQLAFSLAQSLNDPMLALQIGQELMAMTGQDPGMAQVMPVQMPQSDHIAGVGKKEPAIVANARQRAGNVSQPGMR